MNKCLLAQRSEILIQKHRKKRLHFIIKNTILGWKQKTTKLEGRGNGKKELGGEAEVNIKMAGSIHSAKLNAWVEGSRVRVGTTVYVSILSEYYCSWHPLLPKS